MSHWIDQANYELLMEDGRKKSESNSKTHSLLLPKDCDCHRRRETDPIVQCAVCDDGLSYCTVCHGWEAQLLEASCEEIQARNKQASEP